MTLLRSSRLALTPFTLADADDLFLIRNDAKAMEYWDWPADLAVEETRAVAHLMADDVNSGASEIFTARQSGDNQFVGVIDLSEIDGDEADLGFMIRRAFWSKGYGFEAGSCVVTYAWSLGLKRLRARTHADNTRSQLLLEKLGFAAKEERTVEVRRGVTRLCRFYALNKADAP